MDAPLPARPARPAADAATFDVVADADNDDELGLEDRMLYDTLAAALGRGDVAPSSAPPTAPASPALAPICRHCLLREGFTASLRTSRRGGRVSLPSRTSFG